MNHPQLSIEHVIDQPDAIPILATWVQSEWGHLEPDVTYEMRVSEFKQCRAVHTIPETFIAMEDDAPVGMASIIAHDMRTRMELSPWLAAVYVAPAFRNRGIGSILVQTAMKEAALLKLEKLYLFTPDQMHFYQRLGWRVLETVSYRGERVTIMLFDVPIQS